MSAEFLEPPQSIRVEGALQLQHGQTQRFKFRRGVLEDEGFVLRWRGELYAFANSCPHWNVDLDYGSGEFYDMELDRIVCRNHGALFHPQSGLCELGPCSGRSLQRFALAPDGNDITVLIP